MHLLPPFRATVVRTHYIMVSLGGQGEGEFLSLSRKRMPSGRKSSSHRWVAEAPRAGKPWRAGRSKTQCARGVASRGWRPRTLVPGRFERGMGLAGAPPRQG